jgi:hypothetical protein
MTSYQATPRLYANLNLSGALGATTDSYCASSDGTNFYFTDITKLGQSTCSGISPSSADTFEMPAQLFEEGTASAADGGGCQVAILFGLPFGNSWIDAGSTGGHLFKNGDAFALWKSLAVELDRGTALSTGTHIVGGWPQNPPPAPFSDYYNDPLFNEYAYILHYYYDQHRVYALAYDEPGDQFAGFGYNAGDSLYIRVNAVPAASGAAAPTTPEPSPTPPACAPLPTDVGL